jgi:hypothetical protein
MINRSGIFYSRFPRHAKNLHERGAGGKQKHYFIGPTPLFNRNKSRVQKSGFQIQIIPLKKGRALVYLLNQLPTHDLADSDVNSKIEMNV